MPSHRDQLPPRARSIRWIPRWAARQSLLTSSTDRSASSFNTCFPCTWVPRSEQIPAEAGSSDTYPGFAAFLLVFALAAASLSLSAATGFESPRQPFTGTAVPPGSRILHYRHSGSPRYGSSDDAGQPTDPAGPPARLKRGGDRVVEIRSTRAAREEGFDTSLQDAALGR